MTPGQILISKDKKIEKSLYIIKKGSISMSVFVSEEASLKEK